MTGKMSLAGRRIAMTGASGDIGSSVVRALLADGAVVAALDRNPDTLARLKADCGAAPKLHVLCVDVVDEASVAACFGEIRNTLGGLDGLINGAAIEGHRETIDAYDTAVFRSVMDINITGVFLGMKHGIPLLRGNQGAAIVNFASTAGIKGAEGMSAYVASKHAVIGLTRTAAVEWGRHGIRVNCVCPGPISGRMIDSIFGSRAGDPSEAASARMAAIPSRRFGEPDEVAQVVSFLLSDAASFVNGACYAIDGGISAI